jgi:hypothetical protein
MCLRCYLLGVKACPFAAKDSYASPHSWIGLVISIYVIIYVANFVRSIVGKSIHSLEATVDETVLFARSPCGERGRSVAVGHGAAVKAPIQCVFREVKVCLELCSVGKIQYVKYYSMFAPLSGAAPCPRSNFVAR